MSWQTGDRFNYQVDTLGQNLGYNVWYKQPTKSTRINPNSQHAYNRTLTKANCTDWIVAESARHPQFGHYSANNSMNTQSKRLSKLGDNWDPGKSKPNWDQPRWDRDWD